MTGLRRREMMKATGPVILAVLQFAVIASLHAGAIGT
jgi:hypothetical protein